MMWPSNASMETPTDDTDRTRKPNFSEADTMLLLQMYQGYRKIFNCRSMNSHTIRLKQELWQNITDELNRRNPAVHRLVGEVRKKWQNLYTAARRELRAAENSGKPGAIEQLPWLVKHIVELGTSEDGEDLSFFEQPQNGDTTSNESTVTNDSNVDDQALLQLFKQEEPDWDKDKRMIETVTTQSEFSLAHNDTERRGRPGSDPVASDGHAPNVAISTALNSTASATATVFVRERQLNCTDLSSDSPTPITGSLAPNRKRPRSNNSPANSALEQALTQASNVIGTRSILQQQLQKQQQPRLHELLQQQMQSNGFDEQRQQYQQQQRQQPSQAPKQPQLPTPSSASGQAPPLQPQRLLRTLLEPASADASDGAVCERKLDRKRRMEEVDHQRQMWAFERRKARVECEMMELKRQILVVELEQKRRQLAQTPSSVD